MNICSKISNQEYEILIGNGLIKNIQKYVIIPPKVLIVYDRLVDDDFLESLTGLTKETYLYEVKVKESKKSFKEYKKILSVLIKNEFSKNDMIIALGGGVVTDLCGFVASSYKRGIKLLSLPSTTLSMVDASIGGKNGINFKGIKNSVGSFYLPYKVIIDLDVLKSLDERNFNSGLVEAIKCGLIKDNELFNLFLGDINNNLEEIIYRAIKVKCDLVEKDFYDKNERKLLNFGHTFAHAIEAKMNFKVLHGEAVAFGINKMLQGEIKEEVNKIFDKLNIKYDFNYSIMDLIDFIKQDKKVYDDFIDLVVVDEIGKGYIKKMNIAEFLKGE